MMNQLLATLCCAGMLVTMAGCSRGENSQKPAESMPQAVRDGEDAVRNGDDAARDGEDAVRDEENARDAEPTEPVEPETPKY